MNPAEAYIPIDRRHALATGTRIPEQSHGAALFVDISGFTALTGALVQRYGARRGAEELTRQLNQVYSALISDVEHFYGSVIGFSGDAIACWFDGRDTAVDEATGRAIGAALAIQTTMTQFHTIRLDGDVVISLAVKTAIAAGLVRRFTVGDPIIQLIDVLAGTTLDRMAAAEQMAAQNELIIDEASIQPLLKNVTVAAWRTAPKSGRRYAHITAMQPPVSPRPWPNCPPLAPELVRPWVLSAIAARLQGQQGRFLAELRSAAALFLRFTGLDFDHDDQSPQKLDRYVQWVQRIIDQHEGALIQLTTGDKGSYLYASFGAPIAHDDDMQRAVAAARILRQPPVSCPFISTTQIGITYGTMRVGAYGSESRKTYGVLGSETNMAARLMTHAAAGQVVVSETVANAVSDRYETVALGHFVLKGKAEPQPLFAVLQPLVQQRVMESRSKKLYETPLVGREAELAILTDAARQVQADHGQVIRIEGSAGLGKSHLVATFAQFAGQMGFHVVAGGGQSTAQGTAYFAIRQLLQTLLGLDGLIDSPVDAQVAHLTAQLISANPSWSLRIPLLGDLLGLPLPDNATTAAFDARLRQEALITLTLEIIQHYAQQQRLLLLLEDIHWLDEASQGIVLALARSVPQRPLLLLLVHRPPIRENELFLANVATLPEQQFIALQELTAPGIVALVEQRLQGPLAPLAASLIQIQAQGNPFFTEEVVDALVENEQLQQKAGQWTLAPALRDRLRSAGCLLGHTGEEIVNPEAPLSAVDLGIPGTIQGIILARLDRLPETVKLTVKVASVIGRLFGHDLLAQAHPATMVDEELEQELATLLAREFARIEAPTPRRIYIFKHNITQEVVYQTLLSDQRYELHLGVATALETLQPESVEDLAQHYHNSNVEQPLIREKALHYLEAAGLRAKRDYANETALSYFDRALGLEERAAWLKAKVEVLHILGRREDEQRALEQFTTVEDGNPGEVALLYSSYHESLSDYDAAQRYVEQALAVYKQNRNRRGEIQCLNQLGVVLARQADYDAAQAHYQVALTLAENNKLHQEQAMLLYGLSIVNRQQGNYQSARSQVEAALALYRNHENRQGEARMLTALGVIAHMQRDYTTAESYYQQALQIQQLIGDRTGEAGSLMSLGQAARSRGDYSKAAEIIEEAIVIFQVQRNRWWEKIGHNELGVIALLTGDLAVATVHFEQGLALSRSIRDTTGEAITLSNLGQTTRDLGNGQRAQELITQSKTIAEEQGDRNLQAQCWSDLAICALLLHHPQQAMDHAHRAISLFTALGIQSALTTEFCTLAEASFQLKNYAQAEGYARQAFQLLGKIGEEEPDYPQRDYLICHQIFSQVNCATLAQISLTKAFAILQKKAHQISDPTMRRSFLEKVAFNHQIVVAAEQNGLSRLPL